MTIGATKKSFIAFPCIAAVNNKVSLCQVEIGFPDIYVVGEQMFYLQVFRAAKP
jgi:hypothetical protein